MTERATSERGSASVYVVVLSGVVLVAAHVVLLLASLAAANARAGAAADLAALAGARAEADLRAGCDAASAVAEANGAELEGCSVDEAVVTVRVRLPWRWHRDGLTATARAGPVAASG